MAFYRKILFFSLIILQNAYSWGSAAYGTDAAAYATPPKPASRASDAPSVPLTKTEIDGLIAFLRLSDKILRESLDGEKHAFPANNLIKEFGLIKDILRKFDDGTPFHPTPESDRNLTRHLSVVATLTPTRFRRGTGEEYIANLMTASKVTLFSTPFGNEAIVTGEWLTLTALLHEDNFEEAMRRSPKSPSGKGNWHHAFQTHGIIHLLARGVHKKHHRALHPVTRGSSINRSKFAAERLCLNQTWGLLAAIKSILGVLSRHELSKEHASFIEKITLSREMAFEPKRGEGHPEATRALTFDEEDAADVIPDLGGGDDCAKKIHSIQSSKNASSKKSALPSLKKKAAAKREPGEKRSGKTRKRIADGIATTL